MLSIGHKNINLPLTLLGLLFLFFPPLSLSATTTEITHSISDLCKNKSIILLGEQHQHPRSQKLFLDLVKFYAEQGKKILVGLEIPADQQDELNNALTGGETDVSFLYPVIDHPAYRDMIRSLGMMKGNITVQAIDAREEEENRDLAMSKSLKRILDSGDYNVILVLVGNNHVIRELQWAEGVSGGKYLAGYLIGAGADVCSVAQLFKDDAPGADGLLVVRGASGFPALAMKIIQYVNHNDSMKGDKVFDGIVEWM